MKDRDDEIQALVEEKEEIEREKAELAKEIEHQKITFLMQREFKSVLKTKSKHSRGAS